MTLRIIVRTDDASMACNVDGAVVSDFKTFDVEAPEVEAHIRTMGSNTYRNCHIVGVEIMEPKS
jgi:hypothetical protein